MSESVIVVAPPRAGIELFLKTAAADATWQLSSEIANAVITKSESKGTGDLESSGKANSDSTASVQLNYHRDFSLKVAELSEKYPEAKFVFLMRTPIDAMRSSLLAWRTKRFVTHTELAGWWGDPWSFVLVPNWEDLIGLPIPEVVANQWLTANEASIADLSELTDERWVAVSYEELLLTPMETMKKVASKFGFSWNAELASGQVNHASEGLNNAKSFRRHTLEILQAVEKFPERIAKYNEFRLAHSSSEVLSRYQEEAKFKDESDKPQEVTRPSDGTPFSYKYSPSVYELLNRAKSSIAVTTYKSGHLIFIRADSDTKALNCAIKSFNKPMGIAVAGNRFAIGTNDQLLTFTNQASLASRIKTDKLSDVLYLPRSSVNTGDVAIHEMAYGLDEGKPELWFVNTRFSCLSKMVIDYSFEPVWRPEWISGLAAEDRCHLNGLAMVNNRPKYLTALSKTDTPNGWREHKGTSGLIIDIDTNEIIVEGLSMPHSPKWHKDKLWVLESGKGTLATVDIYSGEVTTIATLPGFTRGLSFIDNYAFVGLSQVRESVFSELPVTQTKDERNCGVWMVDIRTGNIIGMVKFEGVVQEIFDVSVMRNTVWPKLETESELTQSSFVLSDDALKQVQVRTNN